MIQVNGSNVLIDIEIDGQRLTDDFVKHSSLELYALRVALTAGFAVPVISMIIGSTNLQYLNKFKEINSAKVYIGTSPDNMDIFTFEIVGRDIKTAPDEQQYILHTGGIITKGNLNSMFHKDQTDGYYKGTAYECLTKAWKEEIKTDIDSNFNKSDDAAIMYKRNHMAQNYFFADMFTHIDIRPSFPLVTIDKNCNLVLRDFQKLKKDGYVHEFTYARHPMPTKVVSKLVTPKAADVIPYVGRPVAVSYKTFANRFCGYKQLTGVNTDTGKLSTVAISIMNDEEGWKLNSLADTLANESSTLEHAYKSEAVNFSNVTSEAYWITAMHNKAHSANMSSIQVKINVEGQYLPNVAVLDLVKLSTLRDTKISGLYIIEALEFGFVQGSPFTTLVYMCRDNFNDVENSKTKEMKLMNTKGLKIPPSKKASIINAIRSSRRGLVHTRNILDKTYINEFERHLISLQSATMTNFWLFGTSIDIKDNISRANSLRNAGNILMNKMINKFIAPPLNRTFYNLLTQSATMQNLFFSVILSVLGADLYGEFNQLVGDLIMFDGFLKNYSTTLSKNSGITAISDSGKTQPANMPRYSTNLTTFREKADGSIYYIEEDNTTGGNRIMMTPEQRQEVVTRIVSDITEVIPDAVDLPIKEIELSESDAIKPEEEIKDIIINEITDDLIDKGYVYDSEIVDAAIESGNTVYIMKADGTVITSTEAAQTMLSSDRLKNILSGNVAFDSVASTKIKRAVGDELKIRHWGTFLNEDDLLEWIITKGFMDKYRTVNATKRMSVKEGRRIFVALPSSEKKVKFYINSERVIMNEMDMAGIGYFTATGREIPYTIYYTTEGYNSNNVTVELRKGV